MTSSLSAQLQRLSTETIATTAGGARKHYPSLLFGPQARQIPLETIYEIGLSGYIELLGNRPALAPFQDTIFHQDALLYDRETRTRELNEQVDATILSFLEHIVDLLHMPAAHKAIEFLLRRFRADLYLSEELVLLFLPYHETLVFSHLVNNLVAARSGPLPDSHILSRLGIKGWPGPRTLLLRPLTSHGCVVLGKVIQRLKGIEKTNVAGFLMYHRFCCVLLLDLVGRHDPVAYSALYMHLSEFLVWGVAKTRHSEARDAVAALLLMAPSRLLEYFVSTPHRSDFLRAILRAPLGRDFTRTVRYLIALSRLAKKASIPSIFGTAETLQYLCSPKPETDLASALHEITSEASRRQTEAVCREYLAAFSMSFSEGLFGFSVEKLPDTLTTKQKDEMLGAFARGLDRLSDILHTLQKGEKAESHAEAVVRMVVECVSRFLHENPSYCDSTGALGKLMNLCVDVDVVQFSSGLSAFLDSVHATSESKGELAKRLLQAMLGNDEHLLLAPIVQETGLSCVLALESQNLEVRRLGYAYMEGVLARAQAPVYALLPVLIDQLSRESTYQLLTQLQALLLAFAESVPAGSTPLDTGLPEASVHLIVPVFIRFYCRSITSHLETEVPADFLLRTAGLLRRIKGATEIDKLTLLEQRLMHQDYVASTAMEMIFPFLSRQDMLAALSDISASRVFSPYAQLFSRSYPCLFESEADASPQMLTVLCSLAGPTSPYADLVLATAVSGIRCLPLMVVNVLAGANGTPAFLETLGEAFLREQSVSEWAESILSCKFDSCLIDCILCAAFESKEYLASATAALKVELKGTTSGASHTPSKRDSMLLTADNCVDADLYLVLAYATLQEVRSDPILTAAHNRVGQLLAVASGATDVPLIAVLQSVHTALEARLADESPGPVLLGAITDILMVISGSTRASHAHLAEFIGLELFTWVDQCATNGLTQEAVDEIMERLGAVLTFLGAEKDGMPDLIVKLSQALGRCLSRLVACCPSELIQPRGRESGDADAELLNQALQTVPQARHVTRAFQLLVDGFYTLVDQAYTLFGQLSDELTETPVDLDAVRAQTYAYLNVLGTLPEFTSWAHAIDNYAFFLVDATEAPMALRETCQAVTNDEDIGASIIRNARAYVTRAALSVAYLNNNITACPQTFLEMLFLRTRFVDRPSALLGAIVNLITPEDTDSRVHHLAVKLLLRFLPKQTTGDTVLDYDEAGVYGDLADSQGESASGITDDHRDYLTDIVPFEEDARRISFLCVRHPALFVCALSVSPDVFEAAFVEGTIQQIWKLLSNDDTTNVTSPDHLIRILGSLLQYASLIHGMRPAFWRVEFTLIRTAIQLLEHGALCHADLHRLCQAVWEGFPTALQSFHPLLFAYGLLLLLPEALRKIEPIIQHLLIPAPCVVQLGMVNILSHPTLWAFIQDKDNVGADMMTVLEEACASTSSLASSVRLAQSLGLSKLLDISELSLTLREREDVAPETRVERNESVEEDENEDEDGVACTLSASLLVSFFIFVGQNPAQTETATQYLLDAYSTLLMTHDFQLACVMTPDIGHAAKEAILGVLQLAKYDEAHSKEILLRLTSRVDPDVIASACQAVYQDMGAGVVPLQAVETLFTLLQTRLEEITKTGRVDLFNDQNIFSELAGAFEGAFGNKGDLTGLPQTVLNVFVTLSETFPSSLLPDRALELLVMAIGADIFARLGTNNGGFSILVPAIAQLVEACDGAILPHLSSLCEPILLHIESLLTDSVLIARNSGPAVESLLTDDDLSVVNLLLCILRCHGRFMSPFLDRTILACGMLCFSGPSRGLVSTTLRADGSPERAASIFEALLPGKPVDAGMRVTAAAELAEACLDELQKVVPSRLLCGLVGKVIDRFLHLVSTHKYARLEPLLHVFVRVVVPKFQSEAGLVTQFGPLISIGLRVAEFRTGAYYEAIFEDFERLESCVFLLLAEASRGNTKKMFTTIITTFWTWVIGQDEAKLPGRSVAGPLSGFQKAFPTEYHELDLLAGEHPICLPRLVSYAHLLSVLAGFDEIALLDVVKQNLYSTIALYVRMSATETLLTSASRGPESQRFTEIVDAPLGCCTTCMVATPLPRPEFFALALAGRYFLLFLYACGQVDGIMRTDAFLAGSSFIVSIVCSEPLAQLAPLALQATIALESMVKGSTGSTAGIRLWRHTHDMCVKIYSHSSEMQRLRALELLAAIFRAGGQEAIALLPDTTGIIGEALESPSPAFEAGAKMLIQAIEAASGTRYDELAGQTRAQSKSR